MTLENGTVINVTKRFPPCVLSSARKSFDGSKRLYTYCMRKYRTWLNQGAIDLPHDEVDVNNCLESIAAKAVNNPRSVFYIYG
ncbi:MAG: hypothetical protein WC344_05275 [Bacilli bacterium]|jgi:hypothetical protein